MIKTDPAVLDELTRFLADRGATEVKVIPSTEVVVDERVRLKCLIPRCESYGRHLMCPPNLPTVAEFRAALARNSRAILVQVSAPLGKEGPKRGSEEVYAPARKLHELVNLGENFMFGRGFHLAIGLIGGPCRLCDACAGPSNEACRFPFKARPAMEGMGIDVLSTLSRAGLSSKFPIKERVTWTGCILL